MVVKRLLSSCWHHVIYVLPHSSMGPASPHSRVDFYTRQRVLHLALLPGEPCSFSEPLPGCPSLRCWGPGVCSLSLFFLKKKKQFFEWKMKERCRGRSTEALQGERNACRSSCGDPQAPFLRLSRQGALFGCCWGRCHHKAAARRCLSVCPAAGRAAVLTLNQVGWALTRPSRHRKEIRWRNIRGHKRRILLGNGKLPTQK